MQQEIINIGDKFYKKCKVAMLPIEKAIKGCILKDMVLGGFRINKDKDGYQYNPKNFIAQHLYILSDEEIKENDFFLWKDKVYKFHYDRGYGIQTKTQETIIFNNEEFSGNAIVNHSNVVGKIIATIDPELTFTAKEHTKDLMKGCDYYLPRLSNAFLKAYCEQGGIDDVLVEYELVQTTSKEDYKYSNGQSNLNYEYRLKIAPDNTITIKPMKENWNREEVKNLLKSISYFTFEQTVYNGREYYIEHEKIDKWIEENLK